MAKIKINGDSSGYVEIAAPNAANNNTLELVPKIVDPFTLNSWNNLVLAFDSIIQLLSLIHI